MDFSSVMFYLLAAFVLGSALRMVLSTNIVHSAFYLMAAFGGVAFLYFLLDADFLGMVQLLIYVGAVTILLVFGVMVTRRSEISKSNLPNKYKYTALFVCVPLFLIVGHYLNKFGLAAVAGKGATETVAQISYLMMNEYVIPFEVAGLLLTVAMVGAILIGKGVKE